MQQQVAIGNGGIASTGPRPVMVIAMYQGPILTGIGDMFPNRALAAGLGLADNIVVSVFGGTAAFMITSLIALTGSNMITALYIMAGGVVGLLGTLPLRR